MFKFPFGLILILALFSSSAWAQSDSAKYEDEDDEGTWVIPSMNEKHKPGIKLGTGFYTFTGGEMDNPTPMLGLNGTIYYRYKYNEKSAIQIETGISFKGSNFANSAGEYSRMRLYYLDAPLTWVRSLNKNNTTHLNIGVQYAYLLNASIFIEPSPIPETQKPALSKHDMMLVAGTQFYSGFVGFQVMAKYGLLNINNGLIPNLNPPLKNKDIHNFALELSLLF
ncbi:MAG: outer membrane beta-barrel protein [Bacteroidota bacterium]|jgi:hypothetical protein